MPENTEALALCVIHKGGCIGLSFECQELTNVTQNKNTINRKE